MSSKNNYPEIDWEEQWALHAPGYRDGYVWIYLNEFGCARVVQPVCLQPGPGFGDLSHPTTHLMLQMMSKHVGQRNVLDIGCGSGILSICAAAMGAKTVLGIDIDPSAVEHSKVNARLNKMEKRIEFGLPAKVNMPSDPLVLMNMIWSEQKEAWHSLPDYSGECLLSGIHITERQAYLESAREKGWKLKEEKELKEWLAFHFLIAGF